MSQRNRQRKDRRKGFPTLGVLLLIVPVLALAVSPAISSAWHNLSEGLPSLEHEEEYKASNDTLIFDGSPDPQLVAVLNTGENRILIAPEAIPEQMKQAIVTIEDDRFYQHSGVDPVGMVRAVLSNFSEGKLAEGGSTITQQYIKNTYVSTEPTIQRKLKEAIYAYQLEQKWSKDRILSEYLNTIYFGDGAYGLEMAAFTYFNKTASNLTLPECALLAALPKSPFYYSPVAHPDNARDRRNLILRKMLNKGLISQEEYDSAAEDPLPTSINKLGPDTVTAPYFIEYVKEQLVARYGASTTFEGGLRVYTTIDTAKQAAAEAAIASILDQEGDPSAAMVSLEPGTSYVRAMVGGRNFTEQKFNVADQGHRQPGSAFKPFVLATAIEKGISPSTTFVSEPKHFNLGSENAVWDVANYDNVYLGKITLEKATVWSDNAVYSELMMQMGPESVAETAHKAGIKTVFTPRPAIALGGLDQGVSPMELASAYGTFANNANRVAGSVDFDGDGPDPISITKVTDSSGTVIDENKPVVTPALDPVVAYYVNSVLKTTAMNGNGRWSNLGRPCAGKSGTTEDHVDAWYSGYTPDLVTTVWIGYPGERISMENIRGVRVTGGAWPAQIWNTYMQKALEGVEPHDFTKPPNADMAQVEICTDSNKVANPWCPHKEKKTFLPGHVPTEKCDIHKPGDVIMPQVTNILLSQAWPSLVNLGMEIELGYAGDMTKPADLIVSQSPKAGTKVRQGSIKVVITVAGAPGAVAPPE
jgi:penicillin-binding protein 1A